MNAIQRNKKKLSKTSVKSILHQPNANKIAFDVPLVSNEEQVKQLELDTQDAQNQLEEGLKAIVNYNANINSHLPCYTSLKPIHDVLIRVYLREPKTMTFGSTTIVVPDTSGQDMVETKRRAASGDRYTQSLTETPFKWLTKAVVVASPNDKLKVGDEVVIPYLETQSLTKIDESKYITYYGAFVHPDSNSIEPPTNVMDAHFGYALLGFGYIKAIL